MSKKNSIYPIILSVFIMSACFSPFLAEAKKDGKEKSESKKEIKLEAKAEKRDNDDKDDDNKNNKSGRKCLVAWGHLFSKGWLKNNTSINVDSDCIIPFGISKKFGGNSTTTVDTTAPVISNLRSSVNIGKATITWNTNEKSDSAVFYSTVSPVNTSSSTPSFIQNNKTSNHKIVLNNLSASTTYFAIVRSKDKSGNTTYSNQISFTTKGPNLAGDVRMPVIKDIVGLVSTSTIQVGWKTNEFATSKVYYSINSPVNLSTSSFVENTALDTSHLLKVMGLSNGTRYYMIVESKDGAGNTTRSSEFSFTTQGTTVVPDTTAPVISAILTNISSSTAVISWTTNEPSTSKVYYNASSTVDVNSTTTPSVTDNSLTLSHSVSIPSLSTSTLYSFIIESRDVANNRGLSGLFSTTTLSN